MQKQGKTFAPAFGRRASEPRLVRAPNRAAEPNALALKFTPVRQVRPRYSARDRAAQEAAAPRCRPSSHARGAEARAPRPGSPRPTGTPPRSVSASADVSASDGAVFRGARRYEYIMAACGMRGVVWAAQERWPSQRAKEILWLVLLEGGRWVRAPPRARRRPAAPKHRSSLLSIFWIIRGIRARRRRARVAMRPPRARGGRGGARCLRKIRL